MTTVLVIALNTFKENLRDKILYNLVIFGLLLVGSSLLLASLTIQEQEKIVKDIGLATINLFGVLIAIFVGIGLVTKEIEKRTIYTILAKPVRRFQFLLGRYCGLALILLVNLLVMTAAFVAVLALGGARPTPGLFQAISLMFLEQLVVVAVTVMFSTFTTPTLSAVFGLGIYVIGRLVGELKALGEKAPSGAFKALIEGLYYVLPNYASFDIKLQAAYGTAVSAAYLASAAGYGLAYAATILVLACLIFQQRDF